MYRVYLRCLDNFQLWVPHPKRRGKKINISIFRQTLRFRNTAHTFARPQFCRFFICGDTLKLVSWAPIETGETVHQTIRNRSGTLESVRQSIIRRVHARFELVGGILRIVVNCDFINNKDPTVTRLGTFFSALCKLQVKYYAFEVFIVECSLSVKIKKKLISIKMLLWTIFFVYLYISLTVHHDIN
jgi:hypothetical protein